MNIYNALLMNAAFSHNGSQCASRGFFRRKGLDRLPEKDSTYETHPLPHLDE